MSRRLIIAVLILVVGLPLLAQNGPDNDPDAAQGFVNNVFHRSNVDSINLYNGQLTVPIAIGPSYPIGPKLKFQAMLTYTSRAWEYGHPYVQAGYPAPAHPLEPLLGDPALGIGWNFNLGAIKPCSVGQGGRCYVSPDGAEHLFNQPVPPSSFKTANADQFLLLYKNAVDESSGYEMWDGDGNRYVFDWQVTGFNDDVGNYIHDFGRGRNGWYLTSLTDPFGNAITVTYYSRAAASPCPSSHSGCPNTSDNPDTSMRCAGTGANSWVPRAIQLPGSGVTISIGLDTAPGTAQMIKTFTFQVFAGGQSTSAAWTLNYQTDTWGGGGYCVVPLVELASIDLPATLPGPPKYLFQYGSFADGLLASTVLLTSMTVPTGASVQYDYGDYSFYHGRAALAAGCTQKDIPADAWVIKSGTLCPNPPNSPTLNMPSDECIPGGLDDQTYLDRHAGVLRRMEVISAVSGPALTAVTTYTQYAFPFGEQGTSGTNQAQSLTVVVDPPDIDNHIVARSYLFWAGPRAGSYCPGYQLPCPGDRTGGVLREAVYDRDPNTAFDTMCIPMPSCGINDLEFCPSHAVRVVHRTYDYDIPLTEVGNRRLQEEITYHQATASNGSCSGCKYHTIAFSNFGGTTWDGNGRHYNIETHSGNLGGDFRQITTTWTPLTSPWLPNLRSIRTETDGSSTANQYFDYKLVNDGTAPNGFLRGTLSWDPGRRKVLGNCRYPDPQGNVSRELTLTIDWPTGVPDPQPQQCTLSWPTFPALAGGGGIFGTHYTYSNGLKTTARWINGSADATWLKYDVTRDAKTGWITSSRDTAGAQTSYVYDSLGRPTSITPPGEVATTVTYDSTTQTTATRNGGGDSSMWSQFRYDGFGRTIREIRQMPGSGVYAKKFTKFDPRGNAYFQSEWVTGSDSSGEGLTLDVPANCSFSGGTHATNVPSSAPGTYRACFDPYGRAQLLTAAAYSGQTTVSRTDSRQSTPAYYSDTVEAVTVACVNGAFVSTTPHCSGGSDAITTTTKDAFGRATSVVEPSGDTTAYGYDVLGKLKSVSQGAQSGTFARTFDYDLLGLLRQEKTPEKGIVNYGSVGPLGNVLQQTEPGGLVVSRVFDYATRLTSVSTNEGRTYVTNTYDEPGRGSSAGKLTTSASTNWALAAPSTVTDSFSYSGVGGRLSSKAETLGGSASFTTTQSFNYNSLGLLSSHSHPRRSGDGAFTVSYTFNAGLPMTELVNGATVVSGIGYGPSGVLASYTTNNGAGHSVTTTISQNGYLPRPSRIQTSGATTNFDSGLYGYDGAGNIRAVGPDTFAYDIRSRLIGANIRDDGGTNHPEAFTYDRYGNILSRAADGANITFSIDPVTNRLVTGAQTQYDLRGNLSLYGVSNYAYDGLSRQTSYKVTGSVDERYIYDASGERMARVVPGTTTVSGAYLYTLAPCRIVDTRGSGGPVYGQTIRTFAANNCGIPANATALAANVISTDVTSGGYFRVFPAGVALPAATTNAMRPGQSRATQAFVSINGPSPGSFSVFGDYPPGYTANFILDVSGYFAPQITSTPDSYNLTFRDPQNRLATKYNLARGVATIDKDYVYLGNQLLATWQPSTGYSFFMTDHLGTPRLQTDVNATTVTRAKNRAFGLPLTGVLPSQGPEYASMEKDSASGNHYDHARYYGAWLGRFHSPDQLGGDAADPQTWNRYAYARNNPLRYIDPNGQDGVEAAKWIREKAQAVVDWGGTHDGAHYSSYTNVATTMSILADWLEAGSGTGDAIGSGADSHDLGMALATDIGRVSSFMFSAATAVEGVFGDFAGSKRSPTIQENKASGDAFRDKVAADLRAQGREVATEVRKATPFGPRVIDVEVRETGKAIGGIETKAGGSPYKPSQRAKDEYLRRVGYSVTVVRDN